MESYKTKVSRSVRLRDRQDHRKTLNFRGSCPSFVPLPYINPHRAAHVCAPACVLKLGTQSRQNVSRGQALVRRGCRTVQLTGLLCGGSVYEPFVTLHLQFVTSFQGTALKAKKKNKPELQSLQSVPVLRYTSTLPSALFCA